MKRIKINSFLDVKKNIDILNITDMAQFFILYESLNSGITEENVINNMKRVLLVMKNSVKGGLQDSNITPSAMISGGAKKMSQFLEDGKSLLSKEFSEVIVNSLSVSEANACMRKIVAAPTAGAAGVIPGAIFKVADKHDIPDKKLINALFVAGGIGEVILKEASIAGAVHGCQAEIGSASAMTAGAITYLFNKNIDVIESAASFALKNILGLVCDPVAGLVEIPCIKRNVSAALNAIASAEMALAGIRTVIPFDEIVLAMAEIGNKMSDTLKETALGGLANTPTAKSIATGFLQKQTLID
jgi:L-serine dehydratase